MSFAPRARARRRILLIEDDPGSRLLVARALEARPHVQLVEATSGLAGTAAIVADPPDLVLLDSRLPDVPGAAVLQWLRSEPTLGPIPVIVVSADAQRATIERMLTAGADDYVTKPVELRRLLNAIDRLITAPPPPGSPGEGCRTRLSDP